mmetsp:Transcript_20438/g.31951  ORF Transcript_20438/g.31951 Transcript_20438/m.31951 type:complete len:112 (+) Transcript_20438:1286-1621(+)
MLAAESLGPGAYWARMGLLTGGQIQRRQACCWNTSGPPTKRSPRLSNAKKVATVITVRRIWPEGRRSPNHRVSLVAFSNQQTVQTRAAPKRIQNRQKRSDSSGKTDGQGDS